MSGVTDEVSAFSVYKAAGSGKTKKKSSPGGKGGHQKSNYDTKMVRKHKSKGVMERNPISKKGAKGKRKRKSGRPTCTTDSSDSDKVVTSSTNRRKRKTSLASSSQDMSSSDGSEEALNGDDVPLVEEALEEMWCEDDDSTTKALDGDANVVNGDNFMRTVLKANESSEDNFSKQLRSKFGLPAPKGKKAKKRRVAKENGLGIAMEPVVDEEQQPHSKKKKTKDDTVDGGSIHMGKQCFQWMTNPIDVDNFFKNTWERRPLHIKRGGQNNYYKHIFSTRSFDDILRNQTVLYGKNLDVTSYSDDKRETHNPGGRAYPAVVWDFYNNGCSLRMLNPQTFSDSVWKLCSTLQEYLGSFVGTNMYLTPPGTQGFAPHYDDVEVFILQLEGKKHWKLYEPRNVQEQLPRYSSRNFSQQDIGEPCLDVVLEAGDMLYMPRGTIHQGKCLPDAHSLHITVSCHQLNSYGDLLETLLPAALRTAMEEDVDFRRGLPIDYMQFMGVANSENQSEKRRALMDTVEKLVTKLFTYAPVDAAADQMGKKFMHSVLPPYLTVNETARCVENGGERWHTGKGRVVNRVELDPDTQIRLIRANCLRLVTDDQEPGTVGVYHCVENTREYQQVEPQFLELDAETAPAIEALLTVYPEFMTVQQLPIEQLDTKMRVVQDLWERKLLMTKKPLEAHYDD